MTRRTLLIAVYALVCAYATGHTEPIEATASTLTLTGLTPAANTPILKNTVLIADLEYSVVDFLPGAFFVMAQVDTRTEHRTTDGDTPNFYQYILTEPHGKLRLHFPVKYVWSVPNIKHPLIVHFYLNKKVDSTHSRIVAKAGPIAFAE